MSGRRLHMRVLLLGALLCLGCARDVRAQAGAAAWPNAHGDPRADAVRIPLTAADKTGAVVTTLRAEDVRVLEDGVPQPRVALTPLPDAPLELTLCVDISASQEAVLPASKAAAHVLLDRLLRTDKDRIALYSFATEGRLEQSFTNERKALDDALDALHVQLPPGYVGGGVLVIGPLPPRPKGAPPLAGATSLWDALQAITRTAYAGPRAADVRRVVILFTDGDDTASVGKKRDAIESLVRAGVVVYVIGVGDEQLYGVSEGGLRKVTEETGGRAYFPRKGKELQSAVDQLRRDLGAPYLLTYQSAGAQGGKPYHKVQIEIVNPELRKRGLQLAHPRGYFSN